jgi:hypothetical protein
MVETEIERLGDFLISTPQSDAPPDHCAAAGRE